MHIRIYTDSKDANEFLRTFNDFLDILYFIQKLEEGMAGELVWALRDDNLVQEAPIMTSYDKLIIASKKQQVLPQECR